LEEAKVTRKGQVTIPAGYRRKHNIREGSRMLVEETERGVLFVPVPDLLSLAGVDKGKYDAKEMRARLDELRARWH